MFDRNVARALLCLVLFCVGCFAVPPPGSRLHRLGQPSGEAFDAPVRVLAWNIYKGNRRQWASSFQRLAREHDLLLIQEAWWAPDTKPVLARIDGMEWWLGVTFEFPYRDGVPKSGTMIGSRVRPSSPVIFRHSPFREALAHTPKSSIAARFPVRGSARELLAVSVHGTNLRIELRPFARHMDQIFELVERHVGPVIVAGDFNTWSEARTEYLFSHVRALGLSSLFPRGPAEDEGDGRMTWSDNYLDHAFVRGLVAKTPPRIVGELEASDHLGLSFALHLDAADNQSVQ